MSVADILKKIVSTLDDLSEISDSVVETLTLHQEALEALIVRQVELETQVNFLEGFFHEE